MKRRTFGALLAGLLLTALAACGGVSDRDLGEIEQHIKDNISSEAASCIDFIIVTEMDDQVYVSIHTIPADGVFIPSVASTALPLVLEKIDKLDVELREFSVTDPGDNTGGVISWSTYDGKTGRLIDTKRDIVDSVSIEDLVAKQETDAAIQRYIEDELINDIAPYISSVSVSQSNHKINIKIRTVAVGGLYIPKVAETVVPPTMEKIKELNLALGEIMITEYSQSNSEGVSNMIAWRTTDGEVGIFSDDSGKDPIVKVGVTIDDLATICGGN